jgi:diadenosine tetraphosphate (Ap4A) HIT family hydrolase
MNDQCAFCDIDQSTILLNSTYWFCIYDKYPVSNGHILIILHRHVVSFFDITTQEYESLFDMINRVKVSLDQLYNPSAYNIGINIGEISGQTIPHVHVHVIPRYFGDVKDPKGGVRGVIPSKQYY